MTNDAGPWPDDGSWVLDDPRDAEATTKADQIRHAIEEMIIAGTLPAGTVLRQDELSRRFGVSRTPIREALRQLAAVGFVSFTPNRGVRVQALDRDEWSQTYLARAVLEGAAAEAAATRITDDQLEELAAANAEFARHTGVLRRADASRDDREQAALAWVESNERFHGGIIQAAELPVVERLVTSLRRVFSGEASWAPGSAADSLYAANLKQHEAIQAALAAHNGRAARALMEAHIMDSWALMESVLDESHRD